MNKADLVNEVANVVSTNAELSKKRGGPKGGEKRATSHQKMTVNRISREG
jgi:hypothetical protein